MKKTFLARRNRLLSGSSFSWGFWALGFALLALCVRLIAPNFFLQLIAPAARVSQTFTAQSRSFLGSFSNASASAARAEQLANQNAVLAIENKTLQQKVNDLTALLDTAGSSNSPGILAGVVARPPEAPYDTLVVAAGTAEKVVVGMEAFAEGGVPIGTVSSVTHDFSRITLFSASGVSTSGWAGAKHTPLTIIGTGGGTMISGVARDAEIAVGDVIFVPGPGMLPLGTVAQVDSDPLSPSVKLRIRSAINLFSIPWIELRATGNVPMIFATTTVL